MSQQIADTDDSMTYTQHGTGQPVLLLHGGMAPQSYWEPVIPQLEEYAAIVPDRSGFGTCLDDPTETPAEAVLDREAEYVRSLVSMLDEQPIVMGHSFGALTAITAAESAAVEAVVAYEPAVLPAAYRAEADLAARMTTLIDHGERREAVKRYIEQVLHPNGIDDLDAWLAEWPVWPECVDLAEEVVRMNRAVESYELPESLPVEAPTLVLTGTEGPEFLRQSARDVHAALPESRFIEFDGVSHSGPAEAPARITSAVDAFVEQKSR